MAKRSCRGRGQDGQHCGAPPLRDGDYCLFHSPDHGDEVAEARRLGGLRRRRDRVTAAAYDFEGLASIKGLRRLVEVAVLDTLGLENGVARNKALAALAQTGLRLLEHGELEERVRALESVTSARERPRYR